MGTGQKLVAAVAGGHRITSMLNCFPDDKDHFPVYVHLYYEVNVIRIKWQLLLKKWRPFTI